MSDGLEHLSKRTRERAFILARNAKSIGLALGAVRFTPHHDYMSFYLANNKDYLIVFCSPDGYLLEIWKDVDGEVEAEFHAIKNIRHFLQWAKRTGYQDIDVVFEDIDHGDDEDLRSWLEDLEDDTD